MSKNMKKADKVFWGFSSLLFGGIIFAMVLAMVIAPAELMCASSYFVAPLNAAEACAQFSE